MTRSPLLAAAGLAFAILPLLAGSGAHPAAAQDAATIPLGDFYFCDASLPSESCLTSVEVGDTVMWQYPSGTVGHTVTHCGDSCDAPTEDPLWDSGVLTAGESFSFTFDAPGTFIYRCDLHPVVMRAVIVVEPQEDQAPTLTVEPTTTTTAPSPTPGPTSAPLPTPTSTSSPPLADGRDGGDNGLAIWWFILGGVAGGVALLAGTAFAIRRYRT